MTETKIETHGLNKPAKVPFGRESKNFGTTTSWNDGLENYRTCLVIVCRLQEATTHEVTKSSAREEYSCLRYEGGASDTGDTGSLISRDASGHSHTGRTMDKKLEIAE